MSYTKPKIYNLALSALLLGKEVVDVATDRSNEVKILNTHWDTALESTLEDLDLDSLATEEELELLASLTEGPWQYVYKYPSSCVFLRRIVSGQIVDRRSTHIAKKTGIYSNQKAIYCNEAEASAEFIPKDVSLTFLSPMAAMAVAYKLAYLSAPLLTGKGAKTLRETIMQMYVMAKTEAQEKDIKENFMYEADDERSEFVEARLE